MYGYPWYNKVPDRYISSVLQHSLLKIKLFCLVMQLLVVWVLEILIPTTKVALGNRTVVGMVTTAYRCLLVLWGSVIRSRRAVDNDALRIWLCSLQVKTRSQTTTAGGNNMVTTPDHYRLVLQGSVSQSAVSSGRQQITLDWLWFAVGQDKEPDPYRR